MTSSRTYTRLLALALGVFLAVPATAQEPTEETEPAGPQPFGANLFTGQFAAQREDGINPDYEILPGDRVRVHAWGGVEFDEVFAVDAQGNIFIPRVGPVRLGGVPARRLTATVREAMSRTYRGRVDVYTNLLTASPVAVFVTGGVQRPGRYAGIPSDSLLFFLDQAGGVDAQRGSYRSITVVRAGQPVAEVDLYAFLLDGTLATPQLQDGDAIVVGRRGSTVEVRAPGSEPTLVELTNEESSGAEVLRVIRPGERMNEVTVRGVRDGERFARAISAAEFSSVMLRDGDVVQFAETGQPRQIVLRLRGEFIGTSSLTVPRGARLIDVLNHVHVDPQLAHIEAIHLRRTSVADQQRRSIRESLDRLERSTMLALSDSSGEAEIRVREAELMRGFIERARTVQPLGRVVTSSGGTQMNMLLQDGDEIIIPTRTNVVRVGGEVRMNQALMFHPELTVGDYVRMSGGYTDRAETRLVILVRPNAEVVMVPSDANIHPGDEILVPPRVDRKVFQHAIDISQIVYQIAIAASVLLRI